MARPEGLPTIFTARPAAGGGGAVRRNSDVDCVTRDKMRVEVNDVGHLIIKRSAAAAANGMATTIASAKAIAEWRARIFLMLSSIYDKRYPKRHYFTKKWAK